MMNCISVTNITILLCLVSLVLTDNYLVILGPESGSHMIAMVSASEAMIQRGHNLTIVSPGLFDGTIRKRLPDKTYLMENYKPSVTVDTFNEHMTIVAELALNGKHIDMLKFGAQKFSILFQMLCEDIFSDEKLLERLWNQQFDLILTHAVFACPVLVAQYLGVPFVAIMPAIPPSMHGRLYCNPVNPAYIPEFNTGYTDKMTFPERLKNSGFSILQWMLRSMSTKCFDEVKIKYNIRPEISTLQSLSEAEILFINSHFVLDFPRPYQPNVVSVGGITALPSKTLPKDLEDFMQSSGDDGVIVFSLGSYFNAMETAMADMFAEAFAKIPQKVIWKSAGHPPSFTPPNVRMANWLPQNDILGHPKTRAMIYHCGVNGVFEAIYHAVPVVCIPLLGDQWANTRRLEAKGVGIQLNLFTLTRDSLLEAINTIINDNGYKTNMTRLSAIFHDEHLPAPQRLVYWMEKVVRHGGASHLRTSAFELNSIQYNLLDVITFIVTAVIIAAIFVTYMCLVVCRFVLRCGKGFQKQKKD